MRTLAEVWPPFALRISAGDLVLTVVTDQDVPGLVELALAGIHPAGEMPFSVPWTAGDPAELPSDMYRYYSKMRAECTPDAFDLVFAVRVGGELVGSQSLGAQDFALTRSAETGSWLGTAFQGRGIGTRMRQAICAFGFDTLGATQLTSAAFVDNPASLAVSRKVGYQPNGVIRLKRHPGEVAANQKLVLTPATFVRGGVVDVAGGTALKAFLRLG